MDRAAGAAAAGSSSRASQIRPTATPCLQNDPFAPTGHVHENASLASWTHNRTR
jgi:hypothetical protein